MNKKINLAVLACILTYMFLFLSGCGKGPMASPEDMANTYLESKYGISFNIIEFSKKTEGGPFREETYSGAAYAVDDPSCQFDVWTSMDMSSFHDNFYAAKKMKQTDKWLRECGADIWKTFKVRDQIRILDYLGDPVYSEESAPAFLDNEAVRSSIYLYLPRKAKDSLAESLYTYLKKIKAAGNGTLYVYILKKEDLEALDIYDPSAADKYKARCSLDIGSGRESVRKACDAIKTTNSKRKNEENT